jgi:hypothetical protein
MKKGIPPWGRIAQDELHHRLHELSRSDGDRLFHPVDAGTYVFSIQASRAHASIPAAPAPADEVTAWEVAVFHGDGRLLNEAVDPELVSLPREWLSYWGGGIGRFVPTAVLRVLLDRFSLGPDDFDRFVLEGSDPD